MVLCMLCFAVTGGMFCGVMLDVLFGSPFLPCYLLCYFRNSLLFVVFFSNATTITEIYFRVFLYGDAN